MSIFRKLKQEWKSLPFARGGYGFGGANTPYPLWFSASLPGAKADYQSAAGILWQNPSAAACFVALTKAFAQAFPYLEKKTEHGWERVEHGRDNALIDLLNTPNPYYSGEKLFGVSLITLMSYGCAFWRLERNGIGSPSEIWFEAPAGIGATGITPQWDATNFITNYQYVVDGRRLPLALEDVVYFRHGLDPANPRVGWAPLALAAREISTLNAASTYTAAVMRNAGAPSGMVSLATQGEAGAEPLTPAQVQEIKKQINGRYSGESAGEVFVSSLPLRWDQMSWSPADMALDAIRQWPQETVCALLATPAIVAQLPTGEQPTYQNLEASMRWWWANTVTPLQDAFATEIKAQLFPTFNLDPTQYRLMWDRSRVLALREDEKEKLEMWTRAYQAGICDRATVKARVGLEVREEDRGVYYGEAKTARDGLKIYDRNGMWHSPDDGKFASAGNGESDRDLDFETAHDWTGDPIPTTETSRFKEAKTHAFQKLKRYTSPDSNEAAVVILVSDGREFDFTVGSKNHVDADVPLDDKVLAVFFHTHITENNFSCADWLSFLTHKNVIESHLITGGKTYSLHKSSLWQLPIDSTEQHIKNIFNDYYAEAFVSLSNQNIRPTRAAIRDIIAVRMAEYFGIHYRIGTRKRP